MPAIFHAYATQRLPFCVPAQFDVQTPCLTIWCHCQPHLCNILWGTGVAITHQVPPTPLHWELDTEALHDPTLLLFRHPFECFAHVDWLGVAFQYSRSNAFVDLLPASVVLSGQQQHSYACQIFFERSWSERNGGRNVRLLNRTLVTARYTKQ